MCGRYSDTAELSDIRLTFQVEGEFTHSWHPTYNIAPSSGSGFEQLIVVAPGDQPPELRLGRFWFIPKFWKKPLNLLPSSFNARAEDLTARPFFREALRSSRCLIPATGWREFVGARGQKQPFHFHREEPHFAFAGLWSVWTSPEGTSVDSFAIITTAPNPVAAKVHDRMPLIMPSGLASAWLQPESDPQELLLEAQAQSFAAPLAVFASDPKGNNPRFEGPEVVRPAPSEQRRLF